VISSSSYFAWWVVTRCLGLVVLHVYLRRGARVYRGSPWPIFLLLGAVPLVAEVIGLFVCWCHGLFLILSAFTRYVERWYDREAKS
jgi:hypothetical protein